VRRILGALALFFVSIATAYGQGARSDGVVLAPTGLPVAGAYVRVCSQPASGSPCSPLASIYSDVNLTIPSLNPLTTDMNGNYFFYVQGGVYTVEFYGQGLVDKQLPDQTVTLPLTSTPTFTTVTVTNGVILDGSTSGTVTLLATPIAGSSTAVFPAASGNVLLDSATQSISGKSFAQNLTPDTTGRTVGTPALPYSGIYIGGVATNNIDLMGSATAARTATLPDNTGTLAELNLAQTWTVNQTFPLASILPGVLVAGSSGQCVVTSGGVATWGTCTGTPGANTALSNLSSVAINTALLCASAGSCNAGSGAVPFGDVFIGAGVNHSLDFGTSGLTANRTATFPDNSGIVPELNFAQSFTATQTFTQQIVSSLVTGTAPFSIASTTLVPNLNVENLNGVIVTGTPSAGQALVATSSSAAGWGAPSTVAIQSYASNVLSGNVTLNTSASAVTTLAVSMPSVGCPCRILATYFMYVNASNSTINMWIQDSSSNTFGSTQEELSSSFHAGQGVADFSPTTYANGTSTTLTLYGLYGGGSGATVEAAPFQGSGTNSFIKAVVQTSN
jgi:hypothetical protein